MRELDAAMEGRSAAFGVLVVPSEAKVPAKMRSLQEMHGNKLVVTFDPEDGGTLALETGYALARARVLMARSESGGVDAAAIEEAATRAIELLAGVKAIKAGLTGAKTHIDRSADAVEAMSRAVREQLDEVCALARESGDGEATGVGARARTDARRRAPCRRATERAGLLGRRRDFRFCLKAAVPFRTSRSRYWRDRR